MDKKIKELLIQMKTSLISIPGISYALASIILSGVGDITQFQTPAKLLAFAGLELSIRKVPSHRHFDGKKMFYVS